MWLGILKLLQRTINLNRPQAKNTTRSKNLMCVNFTLLS